MRSGGHFLLVGFLFLQAAPSPAHDLWLVPDAAVVGKLARVRANSGMKFPQSDHAPDTGKFVRRLILPDGTAGRLDAGEKEGKSGLLHFTPAHPGVYIVAVETSPKLIQLDAEAFNAYLVSDGLPHIYLLRAQEKTLHQPARERYSKSPKALLQIGSDNGDPTRVVGLPLEIVPLQNPFALRPGDTLKVRVLFQGKPLPEANLGWDTPDAQAAPRGTARTDEHGETYIPIAKHGLFTIRLTHMIRPKAEEYEWESFWTTLTFTIPEAK